MSPNFCFYFFINKFGNLFHYFNIFCIYIHIYCTNCLLIILILKGSWIPAGTYLIHNGHQLNFLVLHLLFFSIRYKSSKSSQIWKFKIGTLIKNENNNLKKRFGTIEHCDNLIFFFLFLLFFILI